jgi:hypothetical protein
MRYEPPDAEERLERSLEPIRTEDLIVMDRAYAYARTLAGIAVLDEGGIILID